MAKKSHHGRHPGLRSKSAGESSVAALNTRAALNSRTVRGAQLQHQASPAGEAQVSVSGSHEPKPIRISARAAIGGIGLGVLFGWSYWPVLCRLAHAWETEPDYSHGWLVAPVAAYLLWSRRAALFANDPSADAKSRVVDPANAAGFAWGGLLLLLLSSALRVLGSLWYIDAVEAWSLPLWVAGAVWLMGGRRLCGWAAPGIAFLIFMIPWPYAGERMLSRPLQQVASQVSCWMLQTIGQPGLREGNVVLVGDVRLNVVEACSGLRIFVSIIALAYVYVVLNHKPWWLRLALFAAVVPVAVLANALRIALTGVLHVAFSGEAARHFSHDFAGWVMLPLAGVMLAVWLWYLNRLFVEVEVVKSGSLAPLSRSS